MWRLILLVVMVSADFAVLGDWGRGGTDTQMQMAATMANMDLDFVISTGDNFYPEGIDSVKDSRVHDWVRIYDSKVPWFLCLGNHDYYGNAQAQLDLHDVYLNWNMPARYYNKRIGDMELFFIDTTPWLDYNPVREEKHREWQWLVEQRALIDEQQEWLVSALQTSRAARKIIVGHHPLWTFGEHTHERNDELRVDLTEIMIRFDVESYLCGHDHNLQYVTSNGLHEFVSGGGAWFYDWDWYLGARTMDTAELKFGTSANGFLVVSGTNYSFYSANGEQLFRKIV